VLGPVLGRARGLVEAVGIIELRERAQALLAGVEERQRGAVEADHPTERLEHGLRPLGGRE
jgi:hypothetical protein